MNILFLTPQLPYPPMQGTSLRNFYLMRELARRHQISLLTFMQPGDELHGDSPLHTICREIRTVPAPPRRSLTQRALTSLTSPLPDMALRLPSADFIRALREWTEHESFDVIQVEGIEMASCGIALNASPVRPSPSILSLPALREVTHGSKEREGMGMRATPRLVFDDHNAEYVLQRSAFQSDVRRPSRWHGALYSFVQWQKLARYERRVLRAHDAVAAVSETDARALQQIAPERKIFVVPNGVDTQEFSPSPAQRGSAVRPALDGIGEGADLVFTGKMDYRPNIDAALWFANDVLPRVRARCGQARFVVVGQQPHARLSPLAQRDDVVMTGWVADVRPYIARATVYVAPLRMGGGTRLKVLQAMAMAAPIVSTTLGCDGLSVQHGREVVLADRPADFADAIIRLLNDPALRRQLGARARELAVAQYDWQRIAPRMEELYQSSVTSYQ